METFCRITMHPSLFELKLKTIPLLRRSDITVHLQAKSPQTLFCACMSSDSADNAKRKIGNLALILRNPRHENRRFSESEGMG